jgi:hypothetical protein
MTSFQYSIFARRMASAASAQSGSYYIPPKFPPPGTKLAKVYNTAHKVTIIGILSFTAFLGGILGHSVYNRVTNGQKIRDEAYKRAKERKEAELLAESK